MTTGDLLNHLRMRLATMGLTNLFDAVLITYLDNAYSLFVKEMGGVSDEEEITVLAGDSEVATPDYILKFKAAQLPDTTFPKIINRGDARTGEFNELYGKPGEIKYVLIGTKKNTAKVAYSPLVDTIITFDVDRLPKTPIALIADPVDDVPKTYQLDIVDLAVAQVLGINPDPKIRAQAPGFEARGYAKAHEARDQKAREQSKVVREVAYGGI